MRPTWKCLLQSELQEQTRNRVRQVAPTLNRVVGSSRLKMRMRTSSLMSSIPVSELPRAYSHCPPSSSSLTSNEVVDNRENCSCSSSSQSTSLGPVLAMYATCQTRLGLLGHLTFWENPLSNRLGGVKRAHLCEPIRCQGALDCVK